MPTLSRRKLLAAAGGVMGGMAGLRPGAAFADDTGFPQNFVWGASTSAYQIEGAAAADGRGPSIWDVFSHEPGRTKNGDTGDVACDHYHRWLDDVELLVRGNFSGYRFSTSWPRILPAGSGAIEPRGLDFYDRLTDALIGRGITPYLCLYHWDLPQALQQRGGWTNRDTAEKFADYARVVARRLGDRVEHWVMFNEANVHALFGHGTGGHAPGLTGLANMKAAIHHQNLAQGLALTALRAERASLRLGTVMAITTVRPSADRELDRQAATRFDAYWNGAMLDPLFRGVYPDAIAAEMAPLVNADDLARIKQPVDFFGVNYYGPMYVTDAPGSLFGSWFGAVPAGTRFTAIGWPIDAGGLTESLVRLRDHYGNPDTYITENGACYNDKIAADGTVHDDDRVQYLREHIAAAREAIAAGANLRGYFVWSLLDNFEWAEGFTRRFGIVHVDFTTLKRTPKSSFNYLAGVARRA
jgi:beta-glucosidase